MEPSTQAGKLKRKGSPWGERAGGRDGMFMSTPGRLKVVLCGWDREAGL